jgi:hypothetical protein
MTSSALAIEQAMPPLRDGRCHSTLEIGEMPIEPPVLRAALIEAEA